MLRRLPRSLRFVAGGLVAVVVLAVVFAYERVESRWCSRCWAPVSVNEVGVATSLETRYPLRRTVVVLETPPEIARFVEADHVHDDVPGRGAHQRGPHLSGAMWCKGPMPSEFAFALMTEGGFSDYVAARVADGTVDLATVRELIAVPQHRSREGAWLQSHMDLMRRGIALDAAFRGIPPERSNLFWRDVQPRDRVAADGPRPPR